MPLPRKVLEEALARVNAQRPPALPARIESADEKQFVLSFPDRPMPEGQCIDQDFSDIQWILHGDHDVTTGIIAAREDPEERRYYLTYEVVEWD